MYFMTNLYRVLFNYWAVLYSLCNKSRLLILWENLVLPNLVTVNCLEDFSIPVGVYFKLQKIIYIFFLLGLFFFSLLFYIHVSCSTFKYFYSKTSGSSLLEILNKTCCYCLHFIKTLFCPLLSRLLTNQIKVWSWRRNN